MNEAQATHRRMLHQFAALWAKGMTGVVEQALILSLNDFTTPGEMAFTAKARARKRDALTGSVLGMTQKCPLNKDSGDRVSSTAGRAAPAVHGNARNRGWPWTRAYAIPSSTGGVVRHP